jgi:hypothetical protein
MHTSHTDLKAPVYDLVPKHLSHSGRRFDVEGFTQQGHLFVIVLRKIVIIRVKLLNYHSKLQ